MKLSSLQAIHWYGDGCIGLAAADLARDIREVAGISLPVVESPYIGPGILSAGTVREPEYCRQAAAYFAEPPAQFEEYRATVREDRIVILGTDKRAAMWGIYKLSEKLGVLPCHRYSRGALLPRDALEEETWSDRPKTYRFRGWFLNDEDLLTKRYISGGKRDIDYAYYHDVCDVRSMEEAVETALRLNINMMIPGSIIDIDEPYQKALVDYCVRRGLYVTQHHIEPVGVSWWAYNNYYKRRGMEIPPYSFLQHKDKMVTVWEHYVNLWSQYGENVIWQLGLRGRADTPIWQADAAKMEAEGWGTYISDAIGTQYELIRQAVGDDFHATATMWMEAAAMFAKGELQLPERVMPIYSDVGITQMMSADFFHTPRIPGKGSGIYYHVAYWGSGPHLAIGNNPEKMLYNYDLAIQKGDTAYSILNVSNVREVLYCAAANSRIVWDRNSFRLEDFNRAFARDYFGDESFAGFFPALFDCYVKGNLTDLAKSRNIHAFDFVEQDTPFPYYPINDGDIRIIGLYAMLGKEYKPGWPERFGQSLEKLTNLASRIDATISAPYFLEYEMMVYYLIRLTSWSRLVCLYRETGNTAYLQEAATHLERWLQERRVLEAPPFENWFRGDDKIGISKLLKQTLETLHADKKSFDTDSQS